MVCVVSFTSFLKPYTLFCVFPRLFHFFLSFFFFFFRSYNACSYLIQSYAMSIVEFMRLSPYLDPKKNKKRNRKGEIKTLKQVETVRNVELPKTGPLNGYLGLEKASSPHHILIVTKLHFDTMGKKPQH